MLGKPLRLAAAALLLTAGCAFRPAPEAAGEFSVRRVFGDHMVLQANREIRISGKAEPWRQVRVHLQPEAGGKVSEITAVADGKGHWEASLPPRAPSFAPHRLTVTGAPETPPVEFRDILIGEVWLCSGQSNMEFGMRGAKGGEAAIAGAANYRGKIRLLNLNARKTTAPEGPREEIGEVKWSECTPDTVKNFSAVAYFFGRKLADDLRTPVGLVHSSWGGSRIEAWISRDRLLEEQVDDELLIQAQTTGLSAAQREALARRKAQCDENYRQWWQQLFADHAAATQQAADWKNPDFDDSSWEPAPVPGTLPGYLDGAVWYRKTVDLPKEWTGRELRLSLGLIDDCDETYFNGEKLGGAMPDHPAPWAVRRDYPVPAELVRPGRNVIAVRVVDLNGAGGFLGKPEELFLGRPGKMVIQCNGVNLSGAPELEKLPLAGGDWRRRTEFALERGYPGRPLLADDLVKNPKDPNFPSTLFNGMLHPLTALELAGVIWYQGESNVNNRADYRARTGMLLRDWRKHWNHPQLPFIFTQLAGYDSRASDDPSSPVYWRKLPPEESDWAEFREAQAQCLNDPRTGMAAIYDVGNCVDIHPADKRTVGERLAAEAERVAYGSSKLSAGPLLRQAEFRNGEVRLQFDRIGGGLVAKGGKPGGFALAGADGNWVWAEAEIDGDTVIIRSPEVSEPQKVRYAWSSYPGRANLYNREGFPALPCRAENQERNTR